jgi:hypothetical protein
MEHNSLSTFLGELFSPHTHTHTGKIPHHQSNPGARSRTQDDIIWRSCRRPAPIVVVGLFYIFPGNFFSSFSLPLSLSLIFFLSLSLRPECVVADMRDGSINKRGTPKYLSIWSNFQTVVRVTLRKGKGGNGINYNQIIETSFLRDTCSAHTLPSLFKLKCV